MRNLRRRGPSSRRNVHTESESRWSRRICCLFSIRDHRVLKNDLGQSRAQARSNVYSIIGGNLEKRPVPFSRASQTVSQTTLTPTSDIHQSRWRKKREHSRPPASVLVNGGSVRKSETDAVHRFTVSVGVICLPACLPRERYRYEGKINAGGNGFGLFHASIISDIYNPRPTDRDGNIPSASGAPPKGINSASDPHSQVNSYIPPYSILLVTTCRRTRAVPSSSPSPPTSSAASRPSSSLRLPPTTTRMRSTPRSTVSSRLI